MSEGAFEVPPVLVDAVVERRACGEPEMVAGWPGAWWLRVTYRRPGAAATGRNDETDTDDAAAAAAAAAPAVAVLVPLSDEFAAFQIDLLLRAIKRGERAAARLLFACVHEEWGRIRTARRDPAWDALLAFLAPLAVPDPPPLTTASQRLTAE